jgi:hypothetical protein
MAQPVLADFAVLHEIISQASAELLDFKRPCAIRTAGTLR